MPNLEDTGQHLHESAARTKFCNLRVENMNLPINMSKSDMNWYVQTVASSHATNDIITKT